MMIDIALVLILLGIWSLLGLAVWREFPRGDCRARRDGHLFRTAPGLRRLVARCEACGAPEREAT